VPGNEWRAVPRRLEVDYILPLKAASTDGHAALTSYLLWLADQVNRVIVVDGSPPTIFAAHAKAWAGAVHHTRPDPDLRYANGKVNGVLTGFRRARAARLIVADDDVRYDAASLRRIAELLDDVDLVRPQNYFAPMPWHARWDTARTLLNRAFGADFPGTLGLRREALCRSGGYDGDVLFENLELIRTVRAAGGTECIPLDLFVRRVPPSAGHFARQRVRQAYDSLAQPGRLVAELALAPIGGVLLRRPRRLLGAALAAVAIAELGRRRDGGSAVFPAGTALFAPAWLAERAACAWLAGWHWAFSGGVQYSGRRLRLAAHSESALRRSLGRRSSL
jgi:Glycosyl transferase family 21